MNLWMISGNIDTTQSWLLWSIGATVPFWLFVDTFPSMFILSLSPLSLCPCVCRYLSVCLSICVCSCNCVCVYMYIHLMHEHVEAPEKSLCLFLWHSPWFGRKTLMYIKVSVIELSYLTGLETQEETFLHFVSAGLSNICHHRCFLKEGEMDVKDSQTLARALQVFFVFLFPYFHQFLCFFLCLPVSWDHWTPKPKISKLSYLFWTLLFSWSVNIFLWDWQLCMPGVLLFICPSQKMSSFIPTNQSSVTLWS